MLRFGKVLTSIAYPFAGFSAGVYSAFTTALLPLYLAVFTTNKALIGFLVTISLFQSAIAPPIVGFFSDRVHSTFGQRKIFIVVGTLSTVTILLLTSFTTSLPTLAFLIILTGLTRCLATTPHLAMITENSTSATRSHTMALIAIFGLAGQMLMILTAQILWPTAIAPLAFSILALFFILPMFFLVIFSRDTVGAVIKSKAVTQVVAFFSSRSRIVYLASQLVLWFGISSVLPFFTLFLKDYLGLPQGQALALYFTIIAASGLGAYPFASIGRRIGDSRAFTLGLGAFAIASLLGFFAKGLGLPTLYLLAALAGIGNAATMVFSFAILTKLVPNNSLGLASGVHAFVVSGFAPIAAILSGLLIDTLGYPSMFILLAITTLLSLRLLSYTPFFMVNHASHLDSGITHKGK